MILSLTLSTLITYSTHFSATNTPTPAVPSLQPCQYNLYLLPSSPTHLALAPFHLVSCTHTMSTFLLVNVSTSSPVLPVRDPTFQPAIRSIVSLRALPPQPLFPSGTVRPEGFSTTPSSIPTSILDAWTSRTGAGTTVTDVKVPSTAVALCPSASLRVSLA